MYISEILIQQCCGNLPVLIAIWYACMCTYACMYVKCMYMQIYCFNSSFAFILIVGSLFPLFEPMLWRG